MSSAELLDCFVGVQDILLFVAGAVLSLHLWQMRF